MNKEQIKFKKVIARRRKGKNHAKKHVEKYKATQRARGRMLRARKFITI